MNVQTLLEELKGFGLTREQIADEVGCTVRAVNAWAAAQRGQKRGISGDYLIKMIELRNRHSIGEQPMQVHSRAA